jgi:hypothetical protein
MVRRVFGTTTEQVAYPVDYNCTYSDFCKTFIEFCVRMCAKRDAGQALDVLCRPWAKDWQPRDTSVQVTPNSPEEEKSSDILATQVEPMKDEKARNRSIWPAISSQFVCAQEAEAKRNGNIWLAVVGDYH